MAAPPAPNDRGDAPTPVPLPGVGERLDLRDAEGRALTVIRRRSGETEMHGAGGDAIELDTAATASLGAFLSGRYALPPEIAERAGDALGGLVFDWVTVAGGDGVVGRSIEDLEVRRRTGITIIAILRGTIALVAPDPGTRLAAGDDLVIAGRSGDRDRFAGFVARGG